MPFYRDYAPISDCRVLTVYRLVDVATSTPAQMRAIVQDARSTLVDRVLLPAALRGELVNKVVTLDGFWGKETHGLYSVYKYTCTIEVKDLEVSSED